MLIRKRIYILILSLLIYSWLEGYRELESQTAPKLRALKCIEFNRFLLSAVCLRTHLSWNEADQFYGKGNTFIHLKLFILFAKKVFLKFISMMIYLKVYTGTYVIATNLRNKSLTNQKVAWNFILYFYRHKVKDFIVLILLS